MFHCAFAALCTQGHDRWLLIAFEVHPAVSQSVQEGTDNLRGVRMNDSFARNWETSFHSTCSICHDQHWMFMIRAPFPFGPKEAIVHTYGWDLLFLLILSDMPYRFGSSPNAMSTPRSEWNVCEALWSSTILSVGFTGALMDLEQVCSEVSDVSTDSSPKGLTVMHAPGNPHSCSGHCSQTRQAAHRLHL